METVMSDTDNYKLSFDYYLEYAVVEQSDYLHTEQVFVSRDVNEAFRELLAAPSGVTRRTLQLLLKDPEGKTLYYHVLASYGAGAQLEAQK
jgi:hypothetical protein